MKVKSIATDEIGLNDALAAQGISAIETDLAELILQLVARQDVAHPGARDPPQPDGDQGAVRAHDHRRDARRPRPARSPRPLAATCARSSCRCRWRSRARTSASPRPGTIAVVESEGNGRMCTTLPRVLVTVMGIEKVLPEWRDLEVFLQLLPRSSTAERMNPYTSLWTGVRPGDGPEEFHLVLLDGGRTDVLADEVGRQALHCIRCSACLNVCPVYSRVGGQAYESVYPGADRRGLVAAAVRPRPLRRRCRGRRRCAARVTTSARSRSRSPRCSCTCAGGSIREQKSSLSPEALAMKTVAAVVLVAVAVRACAEAGAARARAAGEGGAAGVERDARAPRAAEADVPGLVA